MIKLYLDEDVPEGVAIALRLRGNDVKTTKEAGNKGLSDIDQMKYAVSKNRVILTCNIADFNKLHTEFIRKGMEHSGIIFTQQLAIGLIVRAILKLITAVKGKKIKNQIIWLSDWIN